MIGENTQAVIRCVDTKKAAPYLFKNVVEPIRGFQMRTVASRVGKIRDHALHLAGSDADVIMGAAAALFLNTAGAAVAQRGEGIEIDIEGGGRHRR